LPNLSRQLHLADCLNALQLPNIKILQAAQCLKFIPLLPKLLLQKRKPPNFQAA
jgi:hypothetical protein